MPYIDLKRKELFERELVRLMDKIHETGASPGDLNYIITRIADFYASLNGRNYAVYNSIVGVLECAKLELYRRKVAPYEDTKIEQNGDVY